MRAPLLDWWDEDPLPLGAAAYRRWSAGWWRAVTAATLRERTA